ncbi:glycerol-3-phosphate dehydrogenase [Methylobacterium haplocladii]|uniref:Glycerol-3-phosphate dehydrogenase n=1 Tax=Methylobacterium haplocladii TaxID=1176176 RepID=A0A512IJB4_9HYPH|nr:glycerol-3-phosphate dehydrogenase [Methylobacterium haplocladii]GEO97791.1 glycerol-3-phosphate dehydrogenase [Methylobacterium haplocladii]GJD82637.1 D-erythritol 1-phosphate dehydrogenase [Methylobacterium haplocladii]GLS57576.1 glycerol-3-phosphate dehydrogenase [Methylobacterium haplocladii]
MQPVYDLLVIGGGINGAGIARDAAGRGLKVLLCERGDLAEFTSSSSTKLIHGGLRYLEYYEFRLVREALAERERLLKLAPHIIWPLRFVLPHDEGLRPAWMLRIGLFLYDHLARLRTLPGSESVRLRTSPMGEPLQERLTRGFVYSDCWVEDSRLVVLNAMDAQARGAEIRTRTGVASARRESEAWVATLHDGRTGKAETVRAKAIVNAAGPWVSETLGETLGINSRSAVRLIKGSHIVVKRLFDGDQAYILQQPDQRIVFAIPYERDFTLIGTTDVPYENEPGAVTISPEETRYLCDCINRSFAKNIGPTDVVWSYSGVRPLYDDAAANASAVTRDYVLDVSDQGGTLPVLSVFGGKITTYRRLAEHAIEKLEPFFPELKPAWTADAILPGGDMADADFDSFLAALRAEKPFLSAETARRLARAYGTRARDILKDARSLADLGEGFDGGLTAREVDYLRDREWVVTAHDILWRRSKLGLRTSAKSEARLQAYLDGKREQAA